MGEKWCEKKQSPRTLGLCFFSHHFPPMSGTLFFFEHLNWQVLSITRLQFFSTRVLDIHLGGLKSSLYWFCPIQIPSKFWGWSNLCTILLATPLSFGEFRGGKNCGPPCILGIYSRLLHPQNLDGIWIGQDQYRLPLAPLNEFPEPWC